MYTTIYGQSVHCNVYNSTKSWFRNVIIQAQLSKYTIFLNQLGETCRDLGVHTILWPIVTLWLN